MMLSRARPRTRAGRRDVIALMDALKIEKAMLDGFDSGRREQVTLADHRVNCHLREMIPLTGTASVMGSP